MLQGSEQNCIRTFSGNNVNVFSVNIDLITIEDIAHSLAHQSRFAGHLPFFYSVAQHCCFCADMAPVYLKLEALMHDASEAYLVDLPRPIKQLIPQYNEIEEVLMHQIAKKFHFVWPMSAAIKEIDDAALKFEWDNYMIKKDWDRTKIWTPEFAKTQFLNYFTNLTKVV